MRTLLYWGRAALVAALLAGCGSAEAQTTRRLYVPLVQREVVDGPVEPAARLADFVKLCVQSHECFLDDVLGDAKFAR